MKVLHVLNEIKFSGAEVMIANAASLFQTRGFELRAFATGQELGDYAPVFEERGVACEYFPINYGVNILEMFKCYHKLYSYLKREEIDVIHVHCSKHWFVCIVAWLGNVRCIKTQHNVFRNRWFTLPVAILRRFIVRKFFGTIFQSIGESVERNERKYYHNPSVRINNWYDSNHFFPPASPTEKHDLRTLLELPFDATVLVSAGSCTPVKNHHDILYALQQLNGKGKFVYLHLGSGSTEDEERRLADSLGVLDNVRFLGNQTDVRKYLAASDIFLMPSRFEGLSIAAIEAMACGLPLIFYDVPGLKDLIKNNDAGYLIIEDAGIMAEKILVLAKDYSLRCKMGNAAHERAVTEYNIKDSVDKLTFLYRAEKP